MTKLDGKSFHIIPENIKSIAKIFPEAVAEGHVNFEVLRQILGDYVEAEHERYSFNWSGKTEALRSSLTPSMATLRPAKEKSKNWENTNNIYIEGDNLEVLKLLQKSYFGKVKMIYIDPPYNTGKDFVYRDNFRSPLDAYREQTGQVDASGNRLTTNTETSGRYHSDWLNMIYPRLRLARNLLSNDGVIFISIDDYEMDNLRKTCHEIFGEDNFVAQFVWERAFAPKNDAKFVSVSHDYILMFAKNLDAFSIGRLPRTREADARYSNPDNDPRGVWSSSDISVKTYSEVNDYPITTPSGRIVEPPAGRCWSLSKNTFLERLQDNRIWFGVDGNGVPRIKRFLSELRFDGMVPTSLLFYREVGHSQEGSQELVSLFGGKGYFDGPKPTRLLKRCLTLADLPDEAIVLDFFSGSGSCADALMQYNAENNKNVQFILVQLPEPTDPTREAYLDGYHSICDLGKERIRRAGEKIKQKIEEQNRQVALEEVSRAIPDIGFKVFTLDSSNLAKWDPSENLEASLLAYVNNVKPDRSREDLLYELMLKLGLELTLPIEKISVDQQTIFTINNGELMVCLDDSIDTKVAEMMVKLRQESLTQSELSRQEWKVVFLDNGFATDSDKTNSLEILKCAGLDEEAFLTV